VRIKDSCWSVRMVYGPREMLGVSIVGPRVEGVLQKVGRQTILRVVGPYGQKQTLTAVNEKCET
jgi:hypothetical protein